MTRHRLRAETRRLAGTCYVVGALATGTLTLCFDSSGQLAMLYGLGWPLTVLGFLMVQWTR